MNTQVIWYLENTTSHAIDFMPFKWHQPMTIHSKQRIPISNLHDREKLEYYRSLYFMGLVLRKEALVKSISQPKKYKPIEEEPHVITRPQYEKQKTVTEIVDLISPTLPKIKPTKRRVEKLRGGGE